MFFPPSYSVFCGFFPSRADERRERISDYEPLKMMEYTSYEYKYSPRY